MSSFRALPFFPFPLPIRFSPPQLLFSSPLLADGEVLVRNRATPSFFPDEIQDLPFRPEWISLSPEIALFLVNLLSRCDEIEALS